jgi:hypothetical protein
VTNERSSRAGASLGSFANLAGLAAKAANAALAVAWMMLGAGAAAAQLGGALPPPLPLLPPDNWWNLDISNAPVDPGSAGFIGFIGADTTLHPDFGGDDPSTSYGVYGFPYAVVPGTQALEPVTFVLYGDESDAGAPGRPAGYPIPAAARTQPKWIEGGFPGGCTDEDCHMLLVDRDHRILFELYQAHWNADHWEAGSGAIFPLDSNARRPAGWTSADAAGLAIFPGLVRYDEVFGPDPIGHAFRFTVRDSNGYVFPASHDAGSNPAAPPLGARLRLKASKDISGYPAYVQKIFQAMKTYGLINADNGSDMYIQGTYDTRWDNDVLNPAFANLQASDFEVVQLGWKGPPPTVACAAGSTRLCLQGSRFAVDVQYILADAESGKGQTLPLTADTGAYWFFANSNIELLVKVLNGCAAGNHFWIFTAGLTNVQTVVTVTDTRSGAARRYVNPQGTPFAPIQDTAALPCP